MSHDLKELNCIIEAALFAAGEPVSVERLIDLFDEEQKPNKQTIRKVLGQLSQDYAERGIELKELASGYQFQVRTDFSAWVQRLWPNRSAKYSRALLEVLAIITYRQPITRGEIEEIRGVQLSSSIINTLMDHEWIHRVGYKKVPGKPVLYGTTKYFLDHFGLKNLDELPKLAEIDSTAQKQLDLNVEEN